MEEIRISGQIAYSMQEEDRVIKFDCGTGICIKDFILHDCGAIMLGTELLLLSVLVKMMNIIILLNQKVC